MTNRKFIWWISGAHISLSCPNSHLAPHSSPPYQESLLNTLDQRANWLPDPSIPDHSISTSYGVHSSPIELPDLPPCNQPLQDAAIHWGEGCSSPSQTWWLLSDTYHRTCPREPQTNHTPQGAMEAHGQNLRPRLEKIEKIQKTPEKPSGRIKGYR